MASDKHMVSKLSEKTEPGDNISVRISGAWLDQCVYDSIQTLLSPRLKQLLPERRVSTLRVDLTTCIASDDPTISLSIEEKRKLLTGLLGNLTEDPRLTILPKVS